jgi:hypothetical protein
VRPDGLGKLIEFGDLFGRFDTFIICFTDTLVVCAEDVRSEVLKSLILLL